MSTILDGGRENRARGDHYGEQRHGTGRHAWDGRLPVLLNHIEPDPTRRGEPILWTHEANRLRGSSADGVATLCNTAEAPVRVPQS